MNRDYIRFLGKIYMVDGEKVTLIQPTEVEEIQICPHFEIKKRGTSLNEEMQEHIAVVLHELAHAQVNHPGREWPWNDWDFVHMTSVMMEEAGEALRAANSHMESDDGPNLLTLYNELAQTAGMCLRIMEEIKQYHVVNRR